MTSVVAAGHPSSEAPRCCATFTALGCSASSSGCDAHSIAGIVRAPKANNFFTIIGFARCRLGHATENVVPAITLAIQPQLQHWLLAECLVRKLLASDGGFIHQAALRNGEHRHSLVIHAMRSRVLFAPAVAR